VIDDVLGLIVLSLLLAFTLGQNPVWAIGKMILYFPIAYIAGHYGFPLLARWLPKMLALEMRIGGTSFTQRTGGTSLCRKMYHASWLEGQCHTVGTLDQQMFPVQMKGRLEKPIAVTYRLGLVHRKMC